MRKCLLLVTCMLMSACSAYAEPQAFTGAKIYPVSGPVIEDGVLLIDQGRIQAVGAVDEVRIPDDARVTDVTGKVIMPGLVDTHSHLGNVDGGDRSNAMHPGVRALDSVNVKADSFRRAMAGGITTVNVMPGSGHLMSGQTLYLKLRADPKTVDDWLFCDDPIRDVCGGMKMANGTNPIRDNAGPFPGTRAKSAELVRSLFNQARDYEHRRDRADDGEVDRDLGMEALLQILSGERTVHFHTHRHDDIITALRMGEEFGFTPVLHHVSEGWRVPEQIAEAGAKASIIMVDSPGGKHEAVNLLWKTAPALEEAGVDTGFHTDDYITDSRLFLRSGGLGVRAGMSREGAIEGLTLAGARILGMEDRIGSLESGKDADFIILSDDPLSVYTHVEETWVEGQRVFDRDDPEQREWATGGYEIFRGEAGHSHGE
ncbi:imidazolonepropionase-like amidohydrolase [Natronospira proteinivora]|uniref:Imidazolonepropionase-like amidohydrolase n=1 Tax=Natronospira proteinivora TaxID=1807133 RepID=A0ABT1G904_9GAMM|nr:amidohydrolase family protein [Natronospira proteinivora]MCP1727787.1 imidazolonepropionase-like amidohydrolase [Natronospira proteinivora]